MPKLLREIRDDWQGQPWAHVFASLGWRTIPVRAKGKGGLFKDFLNLATCDRRQLDEWIALYPGCRWEIITGAETGVIALDIDRKCNADGKVIVWGLENLHRAGIVYPSAMTPTARTPRGGIRQLFRHPGVFVKTGDLVIEGKKVPGIEVKGDGTAGHCIIAGPGYEWQPYYPPTLVLAACPPWMIMPDDQHHAAPSAPPVPIGGGLSAYGEKVIRSARREIMQAPAGARHAALLRVAYSVAGYVDGYGLPTSFALDELERAALAQPRNKPRPTGKAIRKTVSDAFAAGLRHQRKPQR